jgi:ABC-2 type transport system ATP-binding protein
MSNLLEVRDIVKKYGDYTALNNVSIYVPRGTIFGLLGPNGAGKTSLIRIINQIIMPDSGRILFDNKDLLPNDVQYIGYLPEERGLYKSMRVGEQALYLAQLKGMSLSEAKIQLKYWFVKFEIESWWNKKVQELSKGMAQKIQFIVTVMHRPKLLIFDEPFSGFDPINANLIKDEILQLKDEGATVIFSTHRMESVEELCENIALIDNSNKILGGRLSDIKQQFKSNVFDVVIKSEDIIESHQKLQEKFILFNTDINTSENKLAVRIQLTEKVLSNDLLYYLTSLGSVSHFVEAIPSVNEIFIKAVNKNSNE